MRTGYVSLVLGTLMSLSGAGVRGDTIEAGPFSVEVSPVLTVHYEGAVLFSGDRCVAFRGLKPGAPELLRNRTGGQLTRRGNIVTLFAKDGRNVFRREVMVTPDALHLTYEVQAFGDTGGTHLQYELLTPVETFDGAPYQAATGLLRRPRKTLRGKWNSTSSEPFRYLVQTCSYLALETPAPRCTIDFNPMGPWQGTSNYGENWCTAIYHDSERYHFSMLCSGARNGATFTGKIIVRPGTGPYAAIHRNDPLAYTTGFPVTLALNFTDNDTDEKYLPCPPIVASDRPFRWKEAGNIKIVGGRICTIKNCKFAHLLYQDGQEFYSLFIVSGDEIGFDLEPGRVYSLTISNIKLHVWQKQKMVYALTG